jgi:(2Fe-2S) ferredoxin
VTDCSLTVCRGCCCGKQDPSGAKEILLALREQLPGVVIRTSDCLGPCSHKDVMVVTPSRPARQKGARPVWLGWTSDPRTLDDVISWVLGGGPGAATMPTALSLNVFRPQKRERPQKRGKRSA